MNPSTANMPTRMLPTAFLRMTCASRTAKGRRRIQQIVRQSLGKKCWGKWIVAGMMVGSSLLAHPQTGDPTPAPASDQAAGTAGAKPWWRGITTDGYMSLSYTYNDNDPVPRINQ